MAPSPPTVTPLTARAHAFVDDLVRPRLSVGDHHHLTRVLRLSPDDAVTVGDGAGRWRPARVGPGPELADLGEIRADARAEPPLTVAFALVKGDRPELTVQKLTELGIDRIVPFEAARSVVRWDDAKAARQGRRLTAIAREAAMQCRRTWLPDVGAVATFADVGAVAGGGPCRARRRPAVAAPSHRAGRARGWLGARGGHGGAITGARRRARASSRDRGDHRRRSARGHSRGTRGRRGGFRPRHVTSNNAVRSAAPRGISSAYAMVDAQ